MFWNFFTSPVIVGCSFPVSLLWTLSLLVAWLTYFISLRQSVKQSLRWDHAAQSCFCWFQLSSPPQLLRYFLFYITISWCYFTGSYVSIHSSGFRDFLLKPELLRAIVDCGFEHPSEVQHECIPQAILSMDVLCQAKSGMGKTAVFVLATLQQLEPVSMQITSFISH